MWMSAGFWKHWEGLWITRSISHLFLSMVSKSLLSHFRAVGVMKLAYLTECFLIPGSRLGLQVFPFSFLVTNREVNKKLLDRSSLEHRTLARDLSDVVSLKTWTLEYCLCLKEYDGAKGLWRTGGPLCGWKDLLGLTYTAFKSSLKDGHIVTVKMNAYSACLC